MLSVTREQNPKGGSAQEKAFGVLQMGKTLRSMHPYEK